MPRTPHETVPTQFRLRADTLEDLDFIAATLTDENRVPYSRTDAVRYAAGLVAKKLGKNLKKSRKTA